MDPVVVVEPHVLGKQVSILDHCGVIYWKREGHGDCEMGRGVDEGFFERFEMVSLRYNHLGLGLGCGVC